jgi:predicted DNA-binding transcriptional regulator AlpA
MSTEGVVQRYLSAPEAAEYLNISQSMLAKRRLSGDGPRYSKLGKRVVYSIQDLDSWVKERGRASTSDDHYPRD